MKKILKTMGIVLAVLFLAAGIYIGYMMIAYYRLPDKLTLEVKKSGSDGDFAQEFQVKQGEEYLIMTYNIGFGAYTERCLLQHRLRGLQRRLQLFYGRREVLLGRR